MAGAASDCLFRLADLANIAVTSRGPEGPGAKLSAPEGRAFCHERHQPVSGAADAAKAAWIDEAKYERLYEQSIADPEGFWREQGKRIDWIKPYTKVKDVDYTGDVSIRWFEDGTLNVSRQLHRPASARRAATRPRSSGKATTRPSRKHITYRELHEQVCRLANVLKAHGRQEGRPRHHLPADDPRGRLRHAGLRAHRRGPFGRVRRLLAGQPGRPHPGLRIATASSPPTRACAAASKVPLKANVDEALQALPGVEDRASWCGAPAARCRWVEGRDLWYHEACAEGCRATARPSR